jgi:hypothetical protein
MLTTIQLKELFDYKDGNLYWKVYKGPRAPIGSIAGSVRKDGYCRINIDGKSYLTHRLVWLWHGKELDTNIEIDHINNNPSDNRIENLRLATRLQNEYNKPKKGYRFEAGKWRARIKVNGKQQHLGMFDTEDEARLAYLTAAKQTQGNYTYKGAL